MSDYVYQSIFFAYFLFFLLLGLSVYFFVKSLKDGYWGPESEEAKHRMMRDE